MNKKFTRKHVKAPALLLVDYQDRFVLVLGALLMAALFCYYGYKGGMLMGMTTGNFYVAFFMFLLIISLALGYVRWCIRWLDRRFSWLHDWFMRLAYQVVLCWMAPSLGLFGLYVLACKWLSKEILTSGLFEVDMPWISVLLLLVNLCYTIAFFVQLALRHERRERVLSAKYRHYQGLLKRPSAGNGDWRAQAVAAPGKVVKSLESVYFVRAQKYMAQHTYAQIACFIYENNNTFLMLIDGEVKLAANETSLTQVEASTDGFFRKINRSLAIPQHMILSCERLKGGGLQLELKAPLETTRISKKSIPRLLGWVLEAVKEIKTVESWPVIVGFFFSFASQ